jgi:hypothetical protein
VPEADAPAPLVDELRVDLADRLAAPELLLAVLRRGEAVQVAEHLGREGLVHLDHAHVAQPEPGLVEHPRDRADRPHQQVLEGVDRRVVVAAKDPEDRPALRARDLLRGQQHRRRAVGQRRRVARRHRPEVAVEHRLQLRQLLLGGVLARVVVALDIVSSRPRGTAPAPPER